MSFVSATTTTDDGGKFRLCVVVFRVTSVKKSATDDQQRDRTQRREGWICGCVCDGASSCCIEFSLTRLMALSLRGVIQGEGYGAELLAVGCLFSNGALTIIVMASCSGNL